MDNKASLTLAIINPFQKAFRENVYAFAPTFQSTSINRYYNRAATLTFSWQFGGLKPTHDKESRFSDEGKRQTYKRKEKLNKQTNFILSVKVHIYHFFTFKEGFCSVSYRVPCLKTQILQTVICRILFYINKVFHTRIYIIYRPNNKKGLNNV
jgi:hypothetical protein